MCIYIYFYYVVSAEWNRPLPWFATPHHTYYLVHYLMHPPDRCRSGLPSEALEEFLSICMGWKCPSSPALRPRRNGAVSLPTFGLPYRSRSKMDFVHAKGDLSSIAFIEENDQDICSPQTLYERDELGNLEIQDIDTQRWHIAHSLCKSQEHVYSFSLISFFHQHRQYLALAIRFYATHLMTLPSPGSIFPNHLLQ